MFNKNRNARTDINNNTTKTNNCNVEPTKNTFFKIIYYNSKLSEWTEMEPGIKYKNVEDAKIDATISSKINCKNCKVVGVSPDSIERTVFTVISDDQEHSDDDL